MKLVPAQIRQMIIDAASPSRLASPRGTDDADCRRFVEALATTAAAAIGYALDPDGRLEQCEHCGKVDEDLLVETRVDGLHVCGDCFDDHFDTRAAHFAELGLIYGPRQRCPFCEQERTIDTDECGGDGEGICAEYAEAIDATSGQVALGAKGASV